MGSLTSRPKITQQPQVVYVPSSSTDTATTTTTTTTTPAVTTAAPDTIAKERAETVLRRNRGVVGTVLTGFRGLLDGISGGNQPARKTLLGE